MLHRLDLAFYAFDFVISTTGDLYFFEVNPNGQWLWIEQITGMPISKAMPELLSHPPG